MTTKRSLEIFEFELPQNPNINTVRNIINTAFEEAETPEFKSMEDIEDFVKGIVLEHGLWCSKDLEKEMIQLMDLIRDESKFIEDMDEVFIKSMRDSMVKFYVKEYKASLNAQKAYETQSTFVASVKEPVVKSRVRNGKHLTLEAIAEDDNMTKNSRMYKLRYEYGIQVKQIAELMDLNPGRVRSGIKQESRKYV